jgi:hypothetical protein
VGARSRPVSYGDGKLKINFLKGMICLPEGTLSVVMDRESGKTGTGSSPRPRAAREFLLTVRLVHAKREGLILTTLSSSRAAAPTLDLTVKRGDPRPRSGAFTVYRDGSIAAKPSVDQSQAGGKACEVP